MDSTDPLCLLGISKHGVDGLVGPSKFQKIQIFKFVLFGVQYCVEWGVQLTDIMVQISSSSCCRSKGVCCCGVVEGLLNGNEAK